MIGIHILPTVNATLNATAAVLLLTGYSLIRQNASGASDLGLVQSCIEAII